MIHVQLNDTSDDGMSCTCSSVPKFLDYSTTPGAPFPADNHN